MKKLFENPEWPIVLACWALFHGGLFFLIWVGWYVGCR